MKKESLKPNEIGAPTIFVGVGGTGSEIVRKVAEMCKQKETENINFVCLDTNVNDLMSVQKSKAKIYYVQTSTTQTVGDYLDYDEDARKNWFPKNAVMYDKTVSEGAGQVRAISRLALNATVKTGRIDPLYEAIDDLFRKSGQDLKQALRVVLVSTASGGTGSGIILPLSMFIREYVKEKYPNTALIERGFIMLPETLDSVISSTQEKESQRRNAYATIKELNAFMMKGSGFFKIDEDLKRYEPISVDITMPGGENKTLSTLPMDFCFLMDGQDAEDSTMISLAQYKEQAAQALYEQNIGPMQKKAFSVEDNIIKELSNPGNLGRNRFGGIGASVLRYPYDDVADYVACDWALGNIGGENDAGKWGRYDKAYELKRAEARKKGLPASEAPTLDEVYVNTLSSSSDPFSKDIRAKYLLGVNKSVSGYFRELQKHMHASVANNAMIRSTAAQANELSEEIDYTEKDNQGRAKENLGLLRDYEAAVKMNAKKAASTEAEAIFGNENRAIVETRPYTIEVLLKNTYDEIAHPVAARYILYTAKKEFEMRIKSTAKRLDETVESLDGYSSQTTDPGRFDIKSTRKKKEVNLDEVCDAEINPNDHQNLLKRIGEKFGMNDIYPFLNECFVDYFEQIKEFAELTAELEAYRQGLEFTKEICGMYERFFEGFPEKVSSLLRRKYDIQDSLKFVKGDSVVNVCSDEEILNELSRSTSMQSADGAMLDSELNGAIFDAVKANVAFEREIRYVDIVEEDKRIDIFDQIVLGYFQKSVRENCGQLDVNIVEALALEYRLKARIKTREEQSGDDKQIVDHVNHADCVRYIQEKLAFGERLAAPGIQRIRNEEPREVRCVAYNRSLDAMRNYRMGEMFGKGVGAEGCDNISRYEMHFFTAMYNLTPDKLNKFASPMVRETRNKDSGLYHNAYMSYAKYLGPDSTKNMMISTHIDKRWDSIAFMPEMDFDFMKQQMMKIHQSLIYALLYGSIRLRTLSVAAGGKKIFRYENSEERTQDLIVSNGTPCDEFYEILDSLYIDASVVEDIRKICELNHVRDQVRNADYEETFFASAVNEFTLPGVHEGHASLFEIPLAYFNSLPHSRRFVGEIGGLVDAVIKTFKDELGRAESGDDVKFMLCDVLKGEFELFMTNYRKFDELNKGKAASDNMVIDTIYRKMRHVISETPEPDDYRSFLDYFRSLIG